MLYTELYTLQKTFIYIIGTSFGSLYKLHKSIYNLEVNTKVKDLTSTLYKQIKKILINTDHILYNY